MGLLKAMEALQCDAKPKETTPCGEIMLAVSRNDYNHISEALARLAKSKAAKLKALPKGDFRCKSYGFDLHSINSLLDSLRKQLNRQT